MPSPESRRGRPDGGNDSALRQPSLNAVRAFVAAARLGSLKAAAAELSVTAGAVSHHVKQLEVEIGKPLFVRRNNGIELTRDGKLLFDEVAPALKIIARASEAIRKENQIVTMNVSSALAQFWLVPRLVDFQARHPRIAVEMETERRPVMLDESVDLAVSYSRSGSPSSTALRLLTDRAVPMAATAFRRGRWGAAERIEDVPLISSTRDDWEWREWAAGNDFDFARLQIRYRFDTDSPAIRACSSGLGVMLMPGWLGQEGSDKVAPFGAYPHQVLGAYWLALNPRLRPAARTFVSWLRKTAEAAESKGGADAPKMQRAG
jgi:LysR family glycine cleavage system transcriptional activator